jgi:hypothetical protein
MPCFDNFQKMVELCAKPVPQVTFAAKMASLAYMNRKILHSIDCWWKTQWNTIWDLQRTKQIYLQVGPIATPSHPPKFCGNGLSLLVITRCLYWTLSSVLFKLNDIPEFGTM